MAAATGATYAGGCSTHPVRRMKSPSLSPPLSIPFSAVLAGLVAVLVSYAGPLVIVFHAAAAAHLTPAQTSSWIWAVSIGSGLTGAWLSWRLKAPVITAWSTPGAALLVGLLPTLGWAEAIGAYVVAALLLTAIGASGLFDALIRRLPRSIAAAMLAGILLRFGTELFGSAKSQPVLVLAMFAAYLAMKRLRPRYAVALVLLVGVACSAALGLLHGDRFTLALATPQWTTPEFTLHALVNLALPLALVTLTGQHMPGMAVLRAAGYATPASPIVTTTGLASLLLAPFGAHGVNLAAITAAICTGPEAHEDPARRWIAGLACGGFYLLIGTFGAALAGLFAALPKEMIAALAGLALFGAIANGLAGAMADEGQREPALITFVVSASGISLFGLGAAFWGLALGLLAHGVASLRLPRAPKAVERPLTQPR
jgi:benzoate membrane transport protein